MPRRILRLGGRLGATMRAFLGMPRAVTISVMLHVTFVLISMYIILMRATHERQTVFTSQPPQRPSLEPRKLEMKVKVQDLQKQSSRPRIQPRLTSAGVSHIALPDIKAAPAPVRQHVAANVSTFGVSGFGSGIGGGLGEGSGGGYGTSKVNFFGLQDSGQRIALLLDVSESMCEDAHGYPKGYQRVKFRIKDVITHIAEGAFFNVTAFARAVRTCHPRMTLSSAESREAAKKWVDQFNNMEGPFGMADPNYWPGEHGLKADGGTTRLDEALTAAFEQDADTIFVITDGVPWVYKFLEGDQRDEYLRRVADWRDRHRREEESMTDADKKRRDEEDREEQAKTDAENASRIQKGLGPKVREGGGKGGPPPPPRFSDEDILTHVDMLQKKFYESKGKRRARIHVIGYAVDEKTENFLKQLAEKNNGRFRRIKAFM